MKKFLILGGIAASMFAPAPASYAGTAQVGTQDCYVWIDYIDPNIVISAQPPFVTMDPEGSTGVTPHCAPF